MIHDNEVIKIMKDFVEGKMSIEDFKVQYDTNPKIKENLEKDPNRNATIYYKLDLINYLDKIKINTKISKYYLWYEINAFLIRNDVEVIADFKYQKDYLFILDISPSYVEEADEILVNRILEELDDESNEKKILAYCKKRIKEEYKYEKNYPRWIQGAEWPVKNGKPLKFIKRTKEGKDDERVYFHFLDESTNEKVIITQLY